ncbi:MAG: hypothetical protein GF383_09235, partial [Candidatus Lokiarchaeota archaeon]|nr:hypothetical protein [Candidatus Lokiarchaeota archaeon]
MAKKAKETCPYCGREFVYLSRHKCKVKERMESVEDESTQKERRQERVEERKKELTRTLNKDEKQILEIIDRNEDILFEDLRKLVAIERNKLDEMIDLLALRGRIKV